MPNTMLALRLAKQLGCKVEDLFSEREPETPHSITLIEKRQSPGNSRVVAAKIRGRVVGYELFGKSSLNDGFRAADGILSSDGETVRLFGSQSDLERTIMLLGCDPAFAILAAHVARSAPELHLACRFASSHKALAGLASGHAHLAGTHLHNRQSGEENVALAKSLFGRAEAKVIGFSMMEEGLMVAAGNPLGICGVHELADGKIRLANRETGAALRTLLDDYLKRCNIAPDSITGYEDTVSSHSEGAQMVTYRFADAALGLRAVADFHSLDFIPLETVRCDLVVPNDLLDHPGVNIILDILQGAKFKQELSALPGYDASRTGTMIAET